MKPVVLAVDDDPLVLELIGLYLWEHDVRVALSARAGLAILASVRPVLILLDVRMPVMDGMEVLEIIRSRPRLSGARIMMLTAIADRSIIAKAIAAGADGYMLKPFTRENLIRRVNRLLQWSEPKFTEI